MGRHAVLEIRQPDDPDRYPSFSQGRVPAAGVKKSKSVARDLGDATKVLIAEKSADDGDPVGVKPQPHGVPGRQPLGLIVFFRAISQCRAALFD